MPLGGKSWREFTPVVGANLGTANVAIFTGQSNVNNYGVVGLTGLTKPDNAYAKIWSGTQFIPYTPGGNGNPITGENGMWGQEAEYARRYIADNAGKTLFIIKQGYSGMPISQWDPSTGPYFAAISTEVAQARAALFAMGYGSIVTNIVWYHGESAAIADQPTADAYQASLAALLPAMRRAWGTSDTKIAMVRIYDANMTYRSTVRAAQNTVALADPLTYLVNVDDLTLKGGDLYHIDNASTVTSGSRCYDAIYSGTTVEA